MYLIQFRLQLFIQEIVNIKATRLQGWAPARVGRRSPPLENKNVFGRYWGPFCYFFFIWRPFFYVLLIFGGLFIMWGPFCYFLLYGGGLFLGLPPPPTKISAGAHDCKEGSRACSPEIFLYDRNLVSSGHVLLRFCLKNDKNNDKS